MKHFVCDSNYAVLKLVNLVRIAKMSTLTTEKNLKSPKLLPVYNSNIKVKVGSILLLETLSIYIKNDD